MFRTIGAVIAGYLVMAILVAASLSAAWMLTGPSFAYRTGTTDVTSGWLMISLPVSLLAAVVGGFVAASIDRRPGTPAVKGLASLVFILGLILAVVHLRTDRPSPTRPISELSTFEAASYAVQPAWYDFAMPVIGAFGVMLGGKLRRRGTSGSA